MLTYEWFAKLVLYVHFFTGVSRKNGDSSHTFILNKIMIFYLLHDIVDYGANAAT
jgi:hypothetical protein